jgi:ribosomal protein S10
MGTNLITGRSQVLETISEADELSYGGDNNIAYESSIAHEQSSVSHTSSVTSVLSSDFLTRYQYGTLRESKETRKDKQIFIWSPLTIGTNFALPL